MSLYYTDDQITLHHGQSLDVLRGMPDQSVNCCVTSPPYFGLRDYGVEGQCGLEKTPAEYVENMRTLFAEVRRVLAADGTLWLNLGDSYSTRVAIRPSSHQDGLFPNRPELRKSWRRDRNAGLTRMPADNGLPEKNLLGIPWRVAFALQDDGWILRNAIIWNKPNAKPESVTDRLSNCYEHLFLFSRSRRYWFDLDPIREPHAERSKSAERRAESNPHQPGKAAGPGHYKDTAKSGFGAGLRSLSEQGRNPGDVWTIPTTPFPGAHFAVMPVELARRSILAGCKPGGIVLDPFSGSGTTGLAANQLGHRYIGVDLNADYLRDSLTTRFRQGSLIVGEPA